MGMKDEFWDARDWVRNHLTFDEVSGEDHVHGSFFDWDHLHGSYHFVHAAIYILDRITHEEVERFYRESGVFTLHGHV